MAQKYKKNDGKPNNGLQVGLQTLTTFTDEVNQLRFPYVQLTVRLIVPAFFP
jgi:hypothetical protein